MKFLVFNVVVAAALIFLFAGDKGDLAAVANKAERAVSAIATKAVDAVTPQPVGAAKSPAAVSPPQPASAPANMPQEQSVVAAPEPAPEAKPAATAAPAAKPTPPAPAPALPPAVAKRRAEVLGDTPVVAAEGTTDQFMPAAVRKRELQLLSEEMELFSAGAIGR